MSYSDAFDRLTKLGHITPIRPTPDPPVERRSKNWDPNAYCNYHQGNGHDFKSCIKLKHVIQDMVDAKKLPLPPGAKQQGGHASTTVLVIETDDLSFSPTDLIRSEDL